MGVTTVAAETTLVPNAPSTGRQIMQVSGQLQTIQVSVPEGSSVPSGNGLRVIVFLTGRMGSLLLWEGYVSRNAGKTCSLPNVAVHQEDVLNITAYSGSGVTSGAQIRAIATVESDPTRWVGGSGIHFEPAGYGVGVRRVIDLGDPAAGAEYGDQIVPDNAEWRVLAAGLRLLTSSTVANRLHKLQLLVDGTNVTTRVNQVATVPATRDAFIDYMIGATTTGIDLATDAIYILQAALPDLWLPEGAIVRHHTTNLQSGDNYDQGYLVIEERAVA